jgi:hypothetical protein
VPRSILEALAQALLDESYLDLQEAFIDGSFAPPSRRSVHRKDDMGWDRDHGIADPEGLGRRPRRERHAR